MDSTYFLAGGIHEWDKSSMKEVILPTGAHVNVVKDPSNGTFYAIDNVCAHKKASLCLGDIEDLASHSAEGLCVRCPKHRGKFCGGLYFDLHTALTKAPTPNLDPTWKLATFGVKVQDDRVFVHTVPSNGVEPLKAKEKRTVSAPLELKKIKPYNHNSNIYEFVLNNPSEGASKEVKKSIKYLEKAFDKAKVQHLLWHIDMSSDSLFTNDVCVITREYTPISTWEEFVQTRTMKILIKLYPEGLMSQKLAASKEGDLIWFGPPRETAKVPLWPEKVKKKKENSKEQSDQQPKIPTYGFIAGGTGITPAYQLIEHISEIAERGGPAPKLKLLFSNRMKVDTLLQEELSVFQQRYPNLFKLEYTLTGEKAEGYRFGRISKNMLSELFPKSEVDHVFVSGPAGMWESALSILLTLGYEEDDCTELEA